MLSMKIQLLKKVIEILGTDPAGIEAVLAKLSQSLSNHK
jgi:hypothetical protein